MLSPHARVAAKHLSRFGVVTREVKTNDFDALEAAVTPRTRMLFSESPTNPHLSIVDIERFAAVGHRLGIETAIDSTLATPLNLQPLSLGVDYVLHSATKYLAGHNDLLAGCIVGRRDRLGEIEQLRGITSQHAGHLCLLRLKDDDYTYPKPVEFDWSFGRQQGSLQGDERRAKSASGPVGTCRFSSGARSKAAWSAFRTAAGDLQVPGRRTAQLRTCRQFDGIGANEYIVDVAHGVCDFISAVDTPIVWELNIWYHTLNCGYTCRISGETDFPCIYGERVGLGRVYVKLDRANQPLNYDHWVTGIRDGRSYCSDGLSHLIDFHVNGLGVGEKGDEVEPSVLASKAGEKLNIKVNAAAPARRRAVSCGNGNPIADIPLAQKPYWHVERARLGDSRKVPVELIVNGEVSKRKEIRRRRHAERLTFDYTPERIELGRGTHLPQLAHQSRLRRSRRPADPRESQKRPVVHRRRRAMLESQSEGDSPLRNRRTRAAYDVARQAYAKILSESPK